jgi:hypothetical protein
VIIVEDDPCYFLQSGEYVPHSERSVLPKVQGDDEPEEQVYIESLTPS